MLSDFFDAVRRPGSLRSSPLPEKVPFSLPEEYYKNKATELKQQLQSRMDNKNTKDLRIMLKEYLKYRRPHSKDLKNVGVVMQKYLSQDQYFKLMEMEKNEQTLKRTHYRKFVGAERRQRQKTPTREHVSIQTREQSRTEIKLNRSHQSPFIARLKKKDKRIQRRYFCSAVV